LTQERKAKRANPFFFHKKTAKTLTLDLSPDRIVLSTRSNIYFLDIWLPIEIDPDECGAQFDKATHVREREKKQIIFFFYYNEH